ncbi:sulfatase-like hydrolase/transferase [Alienimonas californiensis]|uniref:Arylsulfatase n=1 Tax=Alienimonas californiensis TaxID=2527989 RepID=A0A517PBB3_9PLAN|nr:sulfatase-like hydrolase/transferase [Alienimonas californiensis]QDT16660.1 Arylsulfatase [Alienimonas californiensis]
MTRELKRTIPAASRFAVSLFLLTCSAASAGPQADRPPNVVFVLADDLGWSELGCYGNDFHETPHLDRLAAEGMRFTHAYAAAPVCSPYRAALLTGQHPARIGILDYLRPNSANALSTSHVTLSEMLGRRGYVSGKIGKWHLSGYAAHGAEHEVTPADHGFDEDLAGEVKGVGNGANFWPYVFRDQPMRWIDLPNNRLGENEYLTDRLNLEAVEFIERHRDEPFFLYLSHYAPHTILNGRPDLVEKYRAKHAPGPSGRERCHLCEDARLGGGDPGGHWAVDHNPHLAAMVESIDDGVGLIEAKLTELGLAENTIFIFTSDNGGETNVTSNAPLRGGKSELYEGGIRVPLIVRWPGTVPAGAVCDRPTQNVDYYPTLLEAAGIDPDPAQELDGVSVLKTWKDPAAAIPREALYWHYPLDEPHFLGGVSAGAIRVGEWKLIERFDSGEAQLFSLEEDPGETTNLAAKRPAEADRLRVQLAAWRGAVGARTPSPPLLAEPRQLYFAEHFHPGQLSERLWYNADWAAEDGVLKRLATGSPDTRIFLRDAEYRDAVIRFDFRLGAAEDVRLMTGSGGHYNTVLHVRPDHFFLQTAQDRSAPYFSYRHGECAYKFDPDRWYTMTVEFLGDEAIAHLDHEHLVHAQHPIIDRTREYFALQVDEHAARFDNVQIWSAAAQQPPAGRGTVGAAAGRFPVEKSLREQFDIRSTNAHEWFYQRDETYRDLVRRVDELDAERKERFPDAFRSHKEYKEAVQNERKRLLNEDPIYKEALFATHRADRAIDAWLIARQPELEALPNDRQKAALGRLRGQFAENAELLALMNNSQQAQDRLEAAYPQLYVSDEEINARKKSAAEASRNDPEFRRLTKERAEAYLAQQDYLLNADEELRRLAALVAEGPPSN